jgi:hypothetical protein
VRRALRVLATDVAVELDDAQPLAEVARGLLDGYPPAAGPPELTFRIGAGPDDVPRFELALYREVTARAPAGWLLHAAALWLDDGAVVLAGPSGAGKTTLTLALLRRGARYLTEEVVLLGADGQVRGLARPIHLPAGDPRRAQVPSAWRQLAYPMRGVDQVIAVPPPEVVHHSAAPLRALVRIQHRPDEPARLLAPGAPATMMSLWAATLRRDRDGLDVAAAVLRRHTAHELYAPTVDAAVAALDEVLASRA